MKNGIVYITFVRNKKADRIKELKHSIKSVNKTHPHLPITLFTDKDPKIKGIDNIKIVSINSERVKQNYLYDSPYENTLYLDCDTEIIGSIDEIFGLMARFDIAAAIDHVRKAEETSKIWSAYNNIPDGFSEYAGGVILFKKCLAVDMFFKIWQEKYLEWCKISGKVNDQPSFRVSLYETAGLNIHTLPPEYNLRSKKYHNIIPRIYHNHSLWKKEKQNKGGNVWI